MAYKALYRTYRPRNFEEIAGQEHITRTFKNALKNNKIAHAYLFSGPRGTGKTTIAKIISKAVNCEHAPVSDPCNECDICKGIDNNSVTDVIEIDAASNNGVDEIREIRDKVKYLPGLGKYKVYIIDEVHMLSTGAFNALLKTLEEPPKHVIFILATTEPHKIPATIHSRCQRFDFRGISVPEMIGRLDTIIEEEHISIETEAIKVIAEAAEGGMRDAISLLDQVVSYTETEVKVDDVHAIRGTVSNESLLQIANAIFKNDSVQAIKVLDELVAIGKESQRLVENLIKFYRDLLIFKNTRSSDDSQLLYTKPEFLSLADKVSNNLVFFYIDVLNRARNDMKFTNSAKLYMELALIKMVDKIEKQEIVIEDEFSSLQNSIKSLQEQLTKVEHMKSEVTVVEKVIEKPVVEEVFEQDETEAFDSAQSFGAENSEQNTDEVEQDIPVNKTEPEINVDSVQEDTTETHTDEHIEDRTEEEKSELDLFSLPEDEIEEIEEPYSTYDIRLVEEVLNNGDRETKIRLNKRWFDIERDVEPEDLQYAKLISSGRVVATNGSLIIIEYPAPSTCNRMMKEDIKEKIVKLLSDFHEIELNYLALPSEVWKNKSDEFLKKWREDKDRYITLTPIEHPGLKDIKTVHHDVDDMTPDSVKEAYNMFGKDNVKVRKGE